MLSRDYLKHLLVRTPFEAPAKRVKHLLDGYTQRNPPELRHLRDEPLYLDRIIRRLVRADSNCVDIGCHLGSVLAEFVRCAPRGEHFAVEPVPQKAAWLRKKFPDVKILQYALSDQSGTVTFYNNEEESGFSGLSRSRNDHAREITVQQARLSDLIRRPQIGFIKIDVEGGELGVLRGAFEILDRDHPAIAFECVVDALNHFQTTPTQIHEFLENLGYRVYLMHEFLKDGSPLSGEEFAVANEYPFKALNFLAVHKPGAVPALA
jgi:FkbM family methyltransferase